MTALCVAFCTYNRADRLDKLLAALRAQQCSVPFEILAVNNNSPDNSLEVLTGLQQLPGAPLRIVTETAPGIVPARNRALAETLEHDILIFIDDDELPQAGFLEAAYHAIAHEGAQCVGGRIEIDFSSHPRPAWLNEDISGFLGRLDYGDQAFWIRSPDTPVWSGNVAYDLSLFRDDPTLRFDMRYNRAGRPIGGGEDQAMFQRLLHNGTRIRYRPDMAIWHSVESWRLKRGYFIKLHYLAGLRKGLYELPDYPTILFGAPVFLYRQAIEHSLVAIGKYVSWAPDALRQAMIAAHTIGLISGYRQRIKDTVLNG